MRTPDSDPLQMLFDWLETQKKPTRTNQIGAVSIATYWRKLWGKTRKKMAGVFSKQRFGFASETTIEELKQVFHHKRQGVPLFQTSFTREKG